MKVGKEEIVGLLTAVEMWSDEEFEKKMFDGWGKSSAHMIGALSEVPGVRAYLGSYPNSFDGSSVRPDGLPLTQVEWDTEAIPKTAEQVMEELGEGDPIIHVSPASPHGILLNPSTLQQGEERIVADRVSQVLGG
jgi:hypothetical protein